ncbi:MAG TPA: NB-ARC domain-containing protein [Thermoanaerobaculia bacterium]|nr:NB-ARC domain-containing protein [Thermoanaerobaculia bacterium]
MSKTPNRALIVTALRVEFEAVRAHLTDVREETSKRSIYERGNLTGNGQAWDVTIVEAGAGNISAAWETERAISHLQPEVVIFVGIAGRLKDAKIGDVVVADRIYGYESGKAEKTFKARPRGGQVSHALLQRAKAELRSSDWKHVLLAGPSGEPELLIGPIAAGEKVLASSNARLRKFLATHYNDALAIEMEGVGFLEVAHANRANFIIVRGISDLLDNKSKADKAGWQQIAARNAAVFAIHLLTKFNPNSEDRPAPPPTPEGPTYPWLTPWISRDEKMEELRQALSSHKLVTLHGMGGVGKTRLAVETIRAHQSALACETVFIPLEVLGNQTNELLTAIRNAVGTTEIDAPDFAALRRFLARGDRLLILDNFETVMAEAAEVALLARTKGVRVLVTSQLVIGVTGEKVIAVDPMLIDGPLEGLESYRLFVQLAKLRDANWEPENSEAVRDVLRFTDGLPYLIEIVAARAALQPLGNIAEGLRAKQMSIEARRDASRPDRHSSRQACLEWTFDHLSEREKVLLPRLSVFAGGFDQEAAGAVCSASVEALGGLIDSALLRVDRYHGRYSLLATTREFAIGLLGTEVVLLAAHAAWYIERLAHADSDLKSAGGVQQTVARGWISAEIANVRQAVQWAAAFEPRLFRIGVIAFTFYLLQRYQIGEIVVLNSMLASKLDIRESPTGWATTQGNLGNAYSKYAGLPNGDQEENLRRAITFYTAALNVWTEHEFAWDWAGTPA